MTRKSYASIKSAQESMKEIESLCASGSDTALAKIQAIASKWNRDFKDVDPGWQPPQPPAKENVNLQEQAIALGAFVQTA